MDKDKSKKKPKKVENKNQLKVKNFAEAVKIMANTPPSKNEELTRRKKSGNDR